MNKASSGGVLAIQLLFARLWWLSLHYLVAQGRDLSLAEKKSNVSSNTNQTEIADSLCISLSLSLSMCARVCLRAEEDDTVLTPRPGERPFC